MPKINFSRDCDYSALWYVLGKVGDGITYDFILSDGRVFTGGFVGEVQGSDLMTVALHKSGLTTGERVTFDTAMLVEVQYK